MTERRISTPITMAALLLAALLAGIPAGCSKTGSDTPCAPGSPAALKGAAGNGHGAPAGASEASGLPLEGEVIERHESWNLVFMQAKRIGNERTTITRLRRRGQELMHTESVSRMAM